MQYADRAIVLEQSRDLLTHIKAGGAINVLAAVSALNASIERLSEHATVLEKEIAYVRRNSFPIPAGYARGYSTNKEPLRGYMPDGSARVVRRMPQNNAPEAAMGHANGSREAHVRQEGASVSRHPSWKNKDHRR